MDVLDTGTDELLATLEDRVVTLTLNRPTKRNALSDQLTPALRQILLDLELREDVGCIVITGAGSAFCAGGDISGMGDNLTASDAKPVSHEAQVRELIHRQETLTLRLHSHAKPTIAALPGVAAGAGFCLALACDLRVACESTFVTTAYRNVGFSGDYGGSWLLNALVGPGTTKELYFTGRRVQANEALSLGIFNTVVPDNELTTTVAALAKHIANGPAVALGYMKENINRASQSGLRECLALEADRLVRCASTPDHREAVSAFIEKRPPVFNKP